MLAGKVGVDESSGRAHGTDCCARAEPVIKSMVLRILKFLKEEYQTALTSAITGLAGSGDVNSFSQQAQMVQTPGSIASTPFAAFPLDTSTLMHPSLTRQGTSYPFYSSAGEGSSSQSPPMSSISRNASTDELSQRRAGNASFDSISHSHFLPHQSTSSSGVQPIGTSSIFELLGHETSQTESAAGLTTVLSSLYAGGSGTQTPASQYSGTPIDSPMTMPATRTAAPKPTAVRQGSANPVSAFVQSHPSIQKMEEDFSKRSGKLKPIFIDAISELVDELGMVREQIAAQAMEHIHSACV